MQISSNHAGIRHLSLNEVQIFGFDIMRMVGNRRGSGALAVEDPLLRADALGSSWVLVQGSNQQLTEGFERSLLRVKLSEFSIENNFVR